jgi:UDP-N-acetylglucosamine 2-epimerase (non-hydrolysing)
MEEASVMMTGLNYERIIQGLEILKKQNRNEKRMLGIVKDYDVPNVSEKVLRIIVSYTDYINRNVWRRDK